MAGCEELPGLLRRGAAGYRPGHAGDRRYLTAERDVLADARDERRSRLERLSRTVAYRSTVAPRCVISLAEHPAADPLRREGEAIASPYRVTLPTCNRVVGQYDGRTPSRNIRPFRKANQRDQRNAAGYDDREANRAERRNRSGTQQGRLPPVDRGLQ